MTLSPTRAALKAHQTKIIAAGTACEVARRPVLELTDRIDAAKAAVAKAQAALANLQAAEADAVVNCVPRGPQASSFVGKITTAEAEVARCQRALAALEQKMPEVAAPLADAELSAGIVASATDALIAAVVSEMADDALAAYFAAVDKLALAEATVRTLAAFFVAKRWMPLAEKINFKINTAAPAMWSKVTNFPDWPKLAVSLATDSNATVGLA
jgi:hypothetical protein